jgi:hypothetical protein
MSQPLISTSACTARLGLCFLLYASLASAQQITPSSGLEVYQALKRFQVSGGTAVAENLTLKRDRAEMTFNGTFYFEPPIAGRVRGAVFLGNGTFRAEVPPNEFERENVRRLLKAEVVDSDFRSAVLRFTDDTFDHIGKNLSSGAPSAGAQELASEFEPRLLKETGANISARLAVSILNQESPGFFLAQFDKGKRDRFTLVLDYQSRLPVATFDINGGEKGLIFAHRGGQDENDVWMAFYGLDDYQRGRVQYSDAFDLVAVRRYTMQIDVRDPTKVVKTEVRMDIESAVGGLRAVPLMINESLPEYESVRLKKAMRLKAARFADGAALQAVQEDWEGGVTLFLPAPRAARESFSVVMEFAGDFLYDSPLIGNCYYPRASSGWYPRHGYLSRSTFDLTFRHRKKYRVASAGIRVREEKASDNDGDMITEWKIDYPVALVSFGIGSFEPHTETMKRKEGDLSVTFFSVPGWLLAIKEDFVVAELQNCLGFFSALFGPYPYPSFAAVYHPRPYGQGLPSLLLLPRSDYAVKHTYAFIAHETSHQWWGDIVAWRSYRDQWLSEGFAEYSGVLYTGVRDKGKSRKELVQEMRDSLLAPPITQTGIGRGHVADIGPLIAGHRLITRESENAYNTLIYNKGALVLRMIHFLFTDPQTGNDKAFYDMMGDFVRRQYNGWATTESFLQVASEHFARTPIAQKYRLKDLNWFFAEWVFQAHLPTYRLEYRIERQPDGSVMLKGTLYQENAPEAWFLPLPLVLRFGKDQSARGTVLANGPKAPVAIKLPGRPTEVELDPDMWVLSEKTSAREMK